MELHTHTTPHAQTQHPQYLPSIHTSYLPHHAPLRPLASTTTAPQSPTTQLPLHPTCFTSTNTTNPPNIRTQTLHFPRLPKLYSTQLTHLEHNPHSNYNQQLQNNLQTTAFHLPPPPPKHRQPPITKPLFLQPHLNHSYNQPQTSIPTTSPHNLFSYNLYFPTTSPHNLFYFLQPHIKASPHNLFPDDLTLQSIFLHDLTQSIVLRPHLTIYFPMTSI